VHFQIPKIGKKDPLAGGVKRGETPALEARRFYFGRLSRALRQIVAAVGGAKVGDAPSGESRAGC